MLIAVAVEAGETLPWKLVVTYDDSRAKEIYEDFRCFTDAVWLYPAKDLLFYNADIHGNLITRERMQVLRPSGKADRKIHIKIPGSDS